MNRKRLTNSMRYLLCLCALVCTLLFGNPALAKLYGSVEVPAGRAGFADVLLTYTNTPGVGSGYDVGTNALGPPDHGSTLGYVSMGNGGVLVMQFTDNYVTTSGDSSNDIWVFEISGVAEGTSVDISTDGVSWINVGQSNGSSGVDIDDDIGNGVVAGEKYTFIRLTDTLPSQSSSPTEGADIDAVASLANVAPSPVPEASNFRMRILDDNGVPTTLTDASIELTIWKDETSTDVADRVYAADHTASINDGWLYLSSDNGSVTEGEYKAGLYTEQLWYQVSVNGDTVAQRYPLVAMPYATYAQNTQFLEMNTAADFGAAEIYQALRNGFSEFCAAQQGFWLDAVNLCAIASADLSNLDLTGTDFCVSGLDLSGVDFTNTTLFEASCLDQVTLSNVVWSNTTCPNGANSDNVGNTCMGHFESVTFFSDLTNWQTDVTTQTTSIAFTDVNVLAFDEVLSLPATNEDVGSPLTYSSGSPTLEQCYKFSLNTLQSSAGFVFNDSSSGAWVNSLSIGNINQYENDDFEIDFETGMEPFAFGFDLTDNTQDSGEILHVYAADDTTLLGSITGIFNSSGNVNTFIGVNSTVPIGRITFDEGSGGDDAGVGFVHLARGDLYDGDNDGFSDCAEFSAGSNHFNANSTPP